MRRNVFLCTGLRALSIGAFGAFLFCSSGVASEPLATPRYAIEQPSQSLADSLRSIARQTGASVLFDPGVVHGRQSRPVSGQLSAAEAITRAVDGSGLTVNVMKDGAIVVRPAVPAVGTVPAKSSAPATMQPTGYMNAPVAEGMRVAQAGGQEPRGPDAPASAPLGAGRHTLERIEITGSRLKQISAEGPLPVNTYTRDDIDRSGQPTLERFLASLSEVSVTQGEGTFGPMAGQASVQLRGLPLGSTLVLVNGRRMQAVGSSSGNFFNLNLIPMAAVERVEVVPVGSSAVYGGDALAGVVNIILKKSMEGISLDARVGAGRATGDGSVSIATGRRGEDTSFLLLGTYSKTTPLTMGELGFFRNGDYRRFGGPDARTRFCTPGTVSSASGASLPGLSSNFAGIPVTSAGQALTPADFAATAGQANLCNSIASGNGYALIHGTETLSLHGAADRRLSDAWSVFGELTLVKDRLAAKAGGLVLSNVLVPAANSYNPFGVDVRVTGRLGLENGDEGISRDTDFSRALAGLRGDLGKGWDVEATVSSSRDDGVRLNHNSRVNSAARTAALAATSPDAALNPFATGLAASPEVLRSIFSDGVRDNHGRKDMASAFVRGPLLELPAGPLEAIAGFEYSKDRYETAALGSNSVDSRTNKAAYGELRVPLMRGEPHEGRRWELATLTLAGRRDRYSDFGGASTQQAGLEVRPARTVLFRAAAATSFKPPTLLQTSVEDVSFLIDDLGLVDPANGGAPISGGEVLRTTNPDLKPEKGRAFSLGALWEPQTGTRLGASAWRVKIDGLIALLWPQVTLDNEGFFPGLITRGPPVGGSAGPVTQILYTEVNFGALETAGIDLEASHTWKATGGRWNVSANATKTSRYDVQLAPGSAVDDRLGRRAVDYWSPSWKGRLSIGFDAGAWSLGLTNRYLGAYKDIGAAGRKMGNHWMHDLAGQLDLKKAGFGIGSAKAARLSLAIANVGDRQPEFASTSPYYDITQADWRGRYLTARVSVDW